ncbi:DUF2481 domain-containing protein [Listeria monocytogenes]|nr:DUF2481 domain-containing protein [Listeria monocytogenes]
MAVMEVTENKARQREIISYITNNDLPHNELKELQRELNQLMNRNTEEKKKNYMKKEDGVYTRINGEEKLITKPPENGFGKTTITWSHGKPTTAESVQTIKLNK